MILIIGNTHDDILYFESAMTNRKKEVILEKYEAITGVIYNQEVMLVYNVYTSYVSSSLVSCLINKYFIILVFVVGKCISCSKDLNVGEVIIGKSLYLGDVDQIENTDSKLGQIPGFPTCFETQKDIIEYLINSLNKRTFVQYQLGTIISSNMTYTSESQLDSIKVSDSLLKDKQHVALDSISGGIAVACSMFNVPYICVETVSRRINEKTNVKNYSKVLSSYVGVGKAIVTCISDIGRNQVIGVD